MTRCCRVNNRILRYILFILKSFLLSLFKWSNFKILIYRAVTIFLVLLHYHNVEQIPFEERVENEYYFISFVLFWHIVSMNFKVVEESRRRRNPEYQPIIPVIGILLAVLTAAFIILTPFLSYFNFKITHLQTSYYSLRYLMMFFYIVFNVLICAFPLVNNFLFFLSDGVILSQLASLYMVNEFSMTCFLNIVPVLFVIQNHMLIKGIMNFQKDEQKQKLSFVRLVGKHDAVFLFVIYSIFVFTLNFMDFVSTHNIYCLNFWYTLYAIYVFGKLMDG